MTEGAALRDELVAELLTQVELLIAGGVEDMNARQEAELKYTTDCAELYLRQRGWTVNAIDGRWQKAP